jgi:hypothetical protein
MTTWKPVVGYEGFYEVSDSGLVRSIDRQVLFNGTMALRRGKIISPDVCHAGHRRVALSRDGVLRRVFIHRLVLEAFVGPCPDGMECAHNDNNPANNCVSNLRWDTRSGNFSDKKKFNTYPRGEKASRSKLNDESVLTIFSLRNCLPRSELAKHYNVCAETIRSILSGKTWSHLGLTP